MSQVSPAHRTLVILACLVIVFAGIKLASSIVIPFILAAFIAIICSPMLHFFARFHIPKGISILLIIAIVVGIGVSLAGLVGQSVTDFSKQLPSYKAQLQDKFVWLINIAATYGVPVDKQQLIKLFDPGQVFDVATNTLSSLGGVMANIFLIMLTVIFMLFEAPTLSQKVHLALDDPEMKMKAIDRFLESINSYLAIKTLVSLATGVLVSVFLWILGLDYFLLWGVIAFFLNYIPNIGSIIAAVPAVLLALVTLGPLESGIVAIGYVIINTVMGNIIEPKFMGKGLGLSTLVVFLSLIFWGWLLGTVGMLLSVPLTMVVKIGLENTEKGKWLAVLLGNVDENKDAH
ncbi:AI-2E family transporter [Pseudoalteromonas xiamenensis]|uniref:AI-2E family transporter n=1 Tax=Pseudoalteromonas xiamenensis TaxID=882626 RepID=A0A975DH11_9GAMM|nr:AI-2E family transporter [Pseudoalteromonas xiamenensis]QTH70114.1 AI-2E family transporter [Pseudoalteromonas xiamenensis]QTH71444.1 AI-2E family transporter [Pseudoalteromonas xiamenensis]